MIDNDLMNLHADYKHTQQGLGQQDNENEWLLRQWIWDFILATLDAKCSHLEHCTNAEIMSLKTHFQTLIIHKMFITWTNHALRILVADVS